MCAGIAAGHFRVGEDYRSHPVNAQIAPDEAVADAAASCPMEAIVVTDAATGERLEF
jgi:ferredoxin